MMPLKTNAMSMRRIIFIGNPGLGKSAMLNSLLGEVCFHSGVKIGSGLTRILQTVERNEILYTDTPGLDDIDRRDQAALEISRALRGGGEITLIFVATLDAGRVRSADLATIDAVLTAVESVGVHAANNFSVIINKCDTSVIQKLTDESKMQELRAYFSSRGVRPVSKMLLFPEISGLVGVTDGLLETPQQLRRFVFNECPVIKLPVSELLVSVERFDIRMNDTEKMVKSLEREIASLRKAQKHDMLKQLLNAAVGGASTVIWSVLAEKTLAVVATGVASSTMMGATGTSSQSASVASSSSTSSTLFSIVSWLTRFR